MLIFNGDLTFNSAGAVDIDLNSTSLDSHNGRRTKNSAKQRYEKPPFSAQEV
jgi:hypothetical protein